MSPTEYEPSEFVQDMQSYGDESIQLEIKRPTGSAGIGEEITTTGYLRRNAVSTKSLPNKLLRGVNNTPSTSGAAKKLETKSTNDLPEDILKPIFRTGVINTQPTPS